MRTTTAPALQRASTRLAAWAGSGRRGDLPHLAVQLGLPRVLDARYQTHGYRDGWWYEIALDPHDDDQAWRLLTHWAAAVGADSVLTLPIDSRRHGWVREAFTYLPGPGPFGSEVGIWTHVSADWTEPGQPPQAAAVFDGSLQSLLPGAAAVPAAAADATFEAEQSLTFEHADSSSPRDARHWAHAELAALRMPGDLIDDVVLVVSELVTNCAKFADGPVTVGLLVGESDLQLVVQDAGTLPLLSNPSDEGGRGLQLVDALTQSMVCEQDSATKRITCTFTLPSKEYARA
jgi:anti-sigma regulatory factor (Ser/Thr protein kinase)